MHVGNYRRSHRLEIIKFIGRVNLSTVHFFQKNLHLRIVSYENIVFSLLGSQTNNVT